jgi:ADP-ribose pyrophosphatase
VSDKEKSAKPPLADLPAEAFYAKATVAGPHPIGEGFRDYARFHLDLVHEDGSTSKQTRDLLHVGKVAAVLPIDPVRGEIVMFHQFRLAAHLANGKGHMVEIVAGHVEAGETIAESARRECIEEIGIAPQQLVELFSYLPSPGVSDEVITLFLGIVDASRIPVRAGAAIEHEETILMRVPIDDALAALTSGRTHDGPLILALQWLALNRDRLDEIIRSA